MADLLGNTTSPQLLALIAIPLVGAVFFAVVIVILLNRRRKKSQMKLGTLPEPSPAVKPPAPDSAKDLNTSILSQPPPAAEAVPEATSTGQPPQSISTDSLISSIEPELSQGVLSRQSKAEIAPTAAQQSGEDQMDLARRLENLSAAVPPQTPEPVELLRLLRQPESGQLVVEVAGQRYTKLTDVADKKIGQYILKLVAHFLAFTNGMIGTEAGVKSLYNPRVGQAPLPIGASQPAPESPPIATPKASPPPPIESRPASPEPGLVPKPPPEAEATFLASLREQATQPETPQSRGLFGRTKSAAQPTLPSLNLADEINKIAQARLVASPLAATTELEITSGLGGGIRIKVNDQIYASPDDVPDPEVRALIKASIRQWERS